MMLKGKRKLLLASVLIAFVAVGVAYAAFQVVSNIVYVSMDYTVTLSTSTTNSIVTLTAYVTNGTIAENGIRVDFYWYNYTTSAWNWFDYEYTGANGWSSGYCFSTFTAKANVQYAFKAVASVP
jgi:hypothetical protein